VGKRSRWWRREHRIAGAGEGQASVDNPPIKNIGRTERFQGIIDLCYRLMLFLLTIIGFIAAGCIAGLPSTTCYALADAYTIALEVIGSWSIILTIMLYLCMWVLEYMNKEGETEKWFASWKERFHVLFFLLILSMNMTVILFFPEHGLQNVRWAIPLFRT
jgi:hypothetical protein